jgi:hypothetical protein
MERDIPLSGPALATPDRKRKNVPEKGRSALGHRTLIPFYQLEVSNIRSQTTTFIIDGQLTQNAYLRLIAGHGFCCSERRTDTW